MRRLAVALVHYPVLDREGKTVTTAITNLDLHDIARSAFTYGVERYYIVHPIGAQRELAERVRQHWTEGSGATRIPDRKPPMEAMTITTSLEAARKDFDDNAELWVTSARGDGVAHADAASRLREEGPAVILTFGTGWGLAEDLLEGAQLRLAPIRSPRSDGYNHLSVRAAAAILLDRLAGVERP